MTAAPTPTWSHCFESALRSSTPTASPGTAGRSTRASPCVATRWLSIRTSAHRAIPEDQHRGHGLLGLHDREQRGREDEREPEAAGGLHRGAGERRQRGEQHQSRVTSPLVKPVSIRGPPRSRPRGPRCARRARRAGRRRARPVTVLPASSAPSAVCASRGPSCTSSPTPWPEAVPVVLAVARRVDQVARHGVDRPAVRARARASSAASCALAHEVVDLERLVGERAGRERARAVRAVAVDHAPMSMIISVSRAIATSRGTACGSAPCAPAATIAGNDGASAPDPPSKRDQLDGHLALGAPASPRSAASAYAAVGELGRRAHRVELVRVLDRAELLDERRRPAPARRRRAASRAACACDATLRCASSKPARPRSRFGQRRRAGRGSPRSARSRAPALAPARRSGSP